MGNKTVNSKRNQTARGNKKLAKKTIKEQQRAGIYRKKT